MGTIYDASILIPMEILEDVCRIRHIPVDVILKDCRYQDICEARQSAMWLARRLTTLSYPRIGYVFERDHSTVMHACRVIDKKRANNRRLEMSLTSMEDSIRQALRERWQQSSVLA